MLSDFWQCISWNDDDYHHVFLMVDQNILSIWRLTIRNKAHCVEKRQSLWTSSLLSCSYILLSFHIFSTFFRFGILKENSLLLEALFSSLWFISFESCDLYFYSHPSDIADFSEVIPTSSTSWCIFRYVYIFTLSTE